MAASKGEGEAPGIAAIAESENNSFAPPAGATKKRVRGTVPNEFRRATATTGEL